MCVAHLASHKAAAAGRSGHLEGSESPFHEHNIKEDPAAHPSSLRLGKDRGIVRKEDGEEEGRD